MRSYRNIGQCQQRMISRQRFRFRHVQTRRRHFSALYCVIQCIRVHHFAPGNIHKPDAIFHGGKSSFIKHSPGGRIQRNRHHDKVRSLQQFFPRYIPRTQCGIVQPAVAVMVNDEHTAGLGPFCNGASDIAEADDPQCFIVQVNAQAQRLPFPPQPVLRMLMTPYDVPGRVDQQAVCNIRHRIYQHAGRVADFYIAGVAGFHINIIISYRSLGHHPELRRFLQQRFIDPDISCRIQGVRLLQPLLPLFLRHAPPLLPAFQRHLIL